MSVARPQPFLEAVRSRLADMNALLIPVCWLCDSPVSFEEGMIDEYGEIVHETCYLNRVQPLDTSVPPGLAS
jgi:hypothetical protein